MDDIMRRRHITLSRFLRDYLYFPLGGNQHGSIRRYLNLGIVMLLGGLWHGANWTFAIWGSIHGFLLMLNHAWRKLPFTRHRFYQTKPIHLLAIIITFFLVTLAWIPFRAETIGDARTMLSYLFSTNSGPLGFESFTNFWHYQIAHLRISNTFMDWFTPREMWPHDLSPDFLATKTKPAGMILLLSIIAIFTFPNTSQLFGKFKPALGTETHTTSQNGAIRSLNHTAAFILAMLFILSILRLAHVSPFLYFQF